MTDLSAAIQNADWKTEKHVPVIECPEIVVPGEFFTVSVSLGKAVAHPNTTEHHIRWIQLFFLPDGAKAPIQIGNFEFTAHGESVRGPNQGSVFTHHEASTSVQVGQAGTLIALAYCNIHGLWQASKLLKIA